MINKLISILNGQIKAPLGDYVIRLNLQDLKNLSSMWKDKEYQMMVGYFFAKGNEDDELEQEANRLTVHDD